MILMLERGGWGVREWVGFLGGEGLLTAHLDVRLHPHVSVHCILNHFQMGCHNASLASTQAVVLSECSIVVLVFVFVLVLGIYFSRTFPGDATAACNTNDKGHREKRYRENGDDGKGGVTILASCALRQTKRVAKKYVLWR